MTTLRSLVLGLAVTFVIAAVAAVSPASAQTAKEVEGTWQLVSVTVAQADKKTDLFGADPKGQMLLTPDGRFMITITRADLPKYKSGLRAKGSADEYQATVQGSVAYYGTYTVEGGNLVFKVTASTFPNWVGETQQRALKVSGDELSYSTPPAKSGAVSTLTWKRSK